MYTCTGHGLLAKLPQLSGRYHVCMVSLHGLGEGRCEAEPTHMLDSVSLTVPLAVAIDESSSATYVGFTYSVCPAIGFPCPAVDTDSTALNTTPVHVTQCMNEH